MKSIADKIVMIISTMKTMLPIIFFLLLMLSYFFTIVSSKCETIQERNIDKAMSIKYSAIDGNFSFNNAVKAAMFINIIIPNKTPY